MGIIQTRNEKLRDYAMIVVGVYLMAFAVISFWMPHSMVTGGVSGLAIIIEDVTSRMMERGIPIWLTNLVLNVPLFLLGFRTMGKTFFVRSLFTTILFSVAMHNLTYLPPIPSDLLMGAIFGGVFCGIGAAMIVKAMSSTGGTLLFGAFLHNTLLKHFSVGKIIFGLDSAIIIIGMVVFGLESAMYAVVAVFVYSKVVDAVLEGFSSARAAYIISDKNEEIAEEIMRQMNRGATEISARGMYTKTPRPMLMCVISGRELVQLKQVVYRQDRDAFIIVSEVREVLGEGFTAHSL
ncbi:MAG: YitT family protein [Defluviitaleaceae bacterium]|nr:YitT family protein [Defluviitaleaceae bacterium]MCL2275688.1 YitT family protein [Defluviitaleaceae bacterium]